MADTSNSLPVDEDQEITAEEWAAARTAHQDIGKLILDNESARSAFEAAKTEIDAQVRREHEWKEAQGDNR